MQVVVARRVETHCILGFFLLQYKDLMPRMKQESTPTEQPEAALLEWETPEFAHFERGKAWYAIAGLVLAGLLAYAFSTGSWSMGVAFALLAAVFLLTHRRKPRLTQAKIEALGLRYRNQFYPYHQIQAFWIVYHPPFVQSLYLKPSGSGQKLIKIELNHQAPEAVPLRKQAGRGRLRRRQRRRNPPMKPGRQWPKSRVRKPSSRRWMRP